MFPVWVWVAAGIVAITALIVAVVAWERRQRRERAARWQEHCLMRGWTYQAECDWDDPFRVARVPHFRVGHSRRARHAITGRHGRRPFWAFQYQYTVQTDKSSYTVYLRVVSLQARSSHDGLIIQRRHLGHRIKALFGRGPPGTGSPAFDKKWVARRHDGGDPVRVDDATLQVVLQHPKLLWTWHGDQVSVIQKGRLDPEPVDALLPLVQAFVDATQ